MNIEKIEIEPNQYVWVDKDAKIKEGDYVLSKLFEIVKFGEKYTPSLYKKIIAASPELNLEGIPTYVEWLAEQEYPIKKGGSMWMPSSFELDQSCRQNGFIKGYQKAEKELPTWDDVRKALSEAFKASQEGYNITTEQIIEQLKQEKL